jgi:tetratricopeptide (TPR) repeat protein
MKPNGPGPYVQAGQFMASRNKLTEAGDIYRRGLYLFPDNAQLHTRHAEVLRKSGQPERALKAYVKALQYDPKNTIALAGSSDSPNVGSGSGAPSDIFRKRTPESITPISVVADPQRPQWPRVADVRRAHVGCPQGA